MKTKSRFKSDAFEAIHASASALARVGAIDKATMRKFNASCLAAPVSIAAKQRREAGDRCQECQRRGAQTASDNTASVFHRK
jgi:DNA-binding transcriptional regulator YiaG